jgi:clan AA aspartic protease (TIGR02281 family)
MGIQDRDYWKERSKQEQNNKYNNPNKRSNPQTRFTRLSLLKTILLWLVVFVICMQIFKAIDINHSTKNIKPIQTDGANFVELGQTGNAYYVAGNVNNFPVVYHIDTGATLTSISQKTANLAGIRTCTPRTFETANGSATGCVATVEGIGFGNFHIKNVDVAIMPNITESLLGMNVLSQFAIEQHGTVMRILPQ